MEISLEKEFFNIIQEIQYIVSEDIHNYSNYYQLIDENLNKNTISNENIRNIKYILLDQKNDILKKQKNILENLSMLEKEYSNNNKIFQHNIDSIINVRNEVVKSSKFIFNQKNKISELFPTILSNGNNTAEISPTDKYITEICNQLIQSNKEIINTLVKSAKDLNIVLDEIYSTNTIITEKNKLDYIERFKEDTSLILKQFDSEVSNLAKKYENQFKNYKIDSDQLFKTQNILSKNIDSSLKSLAELNKKIHNIELEYSKIVVNETEKIRLELDESRTKITEQVDSIINEVTSKSNAIETAHSDFKNLVEKAGIYELTKNYKTKSNEEKTEYQTYRNYTSWSIIAAIVSTILVFIVAFIEHYYSGTDAAPNYLLLTSRLSISLMFFVLALYLSKQASKHYECYQENHRTFLQLAALEPFMARMTPEEQKEIRKGLIPSYFNQANDGKYASKADEVDLSSNMTNIFNKLIEKIPSKSEEPDPKKPENTPG